MHRGGVRAAVKPSERMNDGDEYAKFGDNDNLRALRRLRDERAGNSGNLGKMLSRWRYRVNNEAGE
jgi:hypothetical protein